MNTENPAPIPIPVHQRWREFRLRVLPWTVFAIGLFLVIILWKDHAASHTLVGQAEPVLSNVSCYKPGVLAELTVSRFQKVKAGDAVGQVLITEPRILASSLAVIQSEIEMLRITL